MKPGSFLTISLLMATLYGTSPASAQTYPTATRTLQLSAFGGVSGVYTGLAGGKNFAITAGAGLGLPPWHDIRPAIEVRGTYPTDRGDVDSQKSVLAGVDVEFLLSHRFRPYGDFLFGRGQMNYQTFQGADGYRFNGYYYTLTTTYIDSPGAGFNYQISPHLAIKVDGQFERWAGPAPTTSGIVYSKVGTAGLVYYFTFDRRHDR
jgi:hypothetical protein